MFEEAVAMGERLYGPAGHPNLALSRVHLGTALAQLGRSGRRLRAVRGRRRLLRQTLPRGPPARRRPGPAPGCLVPPARGPRRRRGMLPRGPGTRPAAAAAIDAERRGRRGVRPGPAAAAQLSRLPLRQPRPARGGAGPRISRGLARQGGRDAAPGGATRHPPPPPGAGGTRCDGRTPRERGGRVEWHVGGTARHRGPAGPPVAR